MSLADHLERLSIEVVHTPNGVTHAWNRELQQAHCDPHVRDVLPGRGTKDCMHCRSIPGYALRYLAVDGVHPY